MDSSSLTPQTEWLKQQTFLSHSSGGWEDRGPGASRLVSGEATSQFTMSTFSLSSRGRRGGRALRGVCYKAIHPDHFRKAHL